MSKQIILHPLCTALHSTVLLSWPRVDLASCQREERHWCRHIDQRIREEHGTIVRLQLGQHIRLWHLNALPVQELGKLHVCGGVVQHDGRVGLRGTHCSINAALILLHCILVEPLFQCRIRISDVARFSNLGSVQASKQRVCSSRSLDLRQDQRHCPLHRSGLSSCSDIQSHDLAARQRFIKQAQVCELPSKVTILVQIIPPTQVDVAVDLHWITSVHRDISLQLLYEGWRRSTSKHAIHVHREARRSIRPGRQGDHVPLAISQIDMPWNVSWHVIHEASIRVQVRLGQRALIDIIRVLHNGSNDAVGWMSDLWKVNLNLVWAPWLRIEVVISVGEEKLKGVAAAPIVRHPQVHSEWPIYSVVNVIKLHVISPLLAALENTSKQIIFHPLESLHFPATVLGLWPRLDRASCQRKVGFRNGKLGFRTRHVSATFWRFDADTIVLSLGKILVQRSTDETLLLAADGCDDARLCNID